MSRGAARPVAHEHRRGAGQLRAEFPTSPSPRSGSWSPRAWSSRSARRRATASSATHDVARLRYVLAAQRDHYLPLRVIKEHLDALDRGLEPPAAPAAAAGAARAGRRRRAARAARARRRDQRAAAVPRASCSRRPASTPSCSTSSRATAWSRARRRRRRVLRRRRAGRRQTASPSWPRFGLEPRHLRPFRTAADREVGLVEQVVAPLLRQRNPRGPRPRRGGRPASWRALSRAAAHRPGPRAGCRDVAGR